MAGHRMRYTSYRSLASSGHFRFHQRGSPSTSLTLTLTLRHANLAPPTFPLHKTRDQSTSASTRRWLQAACGSLQLCHALTSARQLLPLFRANQGQCSGLFFIGACCMYRTYLFVLLGSSCQVQVAKHLQLLFVTSDPAWRWRCLLLTLKPDVCVKPQIREPSNRKIGMSSELLS